MAMESLLYISESTIEPSEAKGEVRHILAAARAYNPSVGITGALLFTGTHFAQVIEGGNEQISRLIESIVRDQRHVNVNIVARDALTERRFPDWSMAYDGPSKYVSGHVTRLLNSPTPLEKSRAADWLAELLEQFSGYRGAGFGTAVT